LIGSKFAAGAFIFIVEFLCFRLFTASFELLFLAKTAIGRAPPDPLLGGLAGEGDIFLLGKEALIPIEIEPLEAFHNTCASILSRAFSIGIFNAENKFPAYFTGIEPVEERRTGTTQMEITGRRRSKTNSCL